MVRNLRARLTIFGVSLAVFAAAAAPFLKGIRGLHDGDL
jgi:hypothetical protein